MSIINKYILPYEYKSHTYSRKDLYGKYVVDCWFSNYRNEYIAAINLGNYDDSFELNSIEEAMDHADKILIKKGYILIPECDVDKYRILL